MPGSAWRQNCRMQHLATSNEARFTPNKPQIHFISHYTTCFISGRKASHLFENKKSLLFTSILFLIFRTDR